MRLENDTSHENFADNFIRNRGKNFMKLLRKSGGSHFFDSLKRTGHWPVRFLCIGSYSKVTWESRGTMFT